jgi:hypothetical protein
MISLLLLSLIAISSEPIWNLLELGPVGSFVARGGGAGVGLTILLGLLKPRLAGRPRRAATA